ncbi:unnamed protein product [Euphydryas editha]|uniref:PiggyBac transposable element-derived protein domain-containing protein n=1 Tax=Euphydryas editha TaxID=104508 RepID=A0AAU9UTF5_EUPED|nr:unnamed protein product [Euphydryas editha]
MLDAYVYLGKGSYPTNVPSAHFFTLELTEKIHGTNRNLTCDNWFTSIPVAKELLQKQVTLVVDANPGPTAKKRCAVCPRGKDRKTKVFCGMCRKPLCGEHTAPRCEECVTQQK